MDSWNEDERGRKQALILSPKKTIWKYQIPILEVFDIDLPEGSQIIRFANEGGKLWLWAVVNPDKEIKPVTIRAYKTGAEMPADQMFIYVGCAAIYIQAELMLYYFVESNQEDKQ